RERAAQAGAAPQLDLSAEQPRQLAADRQAEPGAAIESAGRLVGLLERLEDELLFVRGDPDPGVGDRELECRRGAAQRLALELLRVGVDTDPQLDRSGLRELECVR